MTTSPVTGSQLDLSRIAQDLQIRKIHVEAVVQLLDEGNTVPFITRYRKERTGGMNEEVIRRIQHRVDLLRQLADRKATILKTIDAQGKLTEELRFAIHAADAPKRLEDLYLPFKPKKRSLATEAREKGLEPLAVAIWTRDPVALNLPELLLSMVNPEQGLNSAEEVLGGARNILAEMTSELADLRGGVRRLVWDSALITAVKADGLPESKGQEYKGYFEFKESVQTIPPHRILAINRGEKEGALKVRLAYDLERVKAAALSAVPLADHPHAELLTEIVGDALHRLVLPAIDREVRRELTDFALEHAISIFARNLRSLLLQPPLRGKRILGIDPGLRTGCKLAALDEHGNLIEQTVIYPHTVNRRDEAFRRAESRMRLEELIRKHHLSVVAIGNGTACRETEKLVAEVIADLESRQFAGAPVIELPAPPAPPPPAEPTSEASTPPSDAPVPSAEADAPPVDSPTVTVAEAAPMAEISGPSEAPPSDDVARPVETIMPAEESVIAQTVDLAPESVAVHAPPPEELTGQPAPVTIEPPAFSASMEPEPSPATIEAPAPVPEVVAEASPSLPLDTSPMTAGDGEGQTSSEALPPAESAPVEQVTSPDQPAPAPAQPPRPPKPPRPQPELPKIDFESMAAAPADLAYVVVNEAGASDYSASDVAREEFPEFDATVRGTISIGRRLQDPLAELVKIDPQHVGVGLYQHDVKAKQLRESLDAVVESCVNHVGVDLNTASVPLLRHVSGLNALVARSLVEHRKANGPFKTREQLLGVEGVGPQRFTQAAGFLKLPGGEEPLDETWIHPESYPVARKILEDVGLTPADLRERAKLDELGEKFKKVHPEVYADRFQTGVLTVKDIFDALLKPSRDPREDLPPPVFRKNVLKIEDLQAGMELKGTVLNVVDFGAFVDIGLKDSGLVHISQMANRYIKNPYEVVSVGDVVTVWVRAVDMERRHVSLTMIAPGAERRPPERRGAPGRDDQQQAPNQQRDPRQQREPRRDGPPQRERAGGPPQRSGGGGGPPRDQGSRDQGPRGRARGFRRDQPRQDQPAAAPPPVRRPDAKPKPLPNLTKDAIAGKAPLFTFGELAAFFKAKEEPTAAPPAPASPPPEPEAPPPPAESPVE